MRDSLREILFACRSLARRPSFLLGSVLTLALGLGANVAALSISYASWWRPLPYHEPGQLVLLWEKSPEYGDSLLPASPANFLAWRSSGEIFSDVTAYSEGLRSLTLTGHGEPRVVRALSVYANFFSVLGVKPKLGRWLREEESWPGPPPAIVVSERLWREVGADPALVGRTLVLDEIAYTVVGVMPDRFEPPLPKADLWAPLKWRPSDRESPMFRMAHFLRPVGRLQHGVSVEQATASVHAIAAQRQADAPPGGYPTTSGITLLHEWVVGDRKRSLALLLGSSAMVLLIACVNVTSLQLARTTGREGELALRLALGATRSKLARLVLAESLVLSVLGGLAGLLICWSAIRMALAFAPRELALDELARMGVIPFVFGLAGILVAAPAFGLIPAIHGWRTRERGLVPGASRSETPSPRSHRVGRFLVAAEVATATILLLSAGLLLKSFLTVQQVELGFRPEGVLTASLSLPPKRYSDPAQITGFYDRLLEQAAGLPGVRAVAVVDSLPAIGHRWSSELRIEGRPPAQIPMEFTHRTVSPGHLEAFGVELRSGRFFEQRDTRAPLPGVVVNQALARHFFSGENPVGRRVSFDREDGETSGWKTILGVVADESLDSPKSEPRPALLELYSDDPRWTMSLALRTDGDPMRLGAALRRTVASLDAMIPLSEIKPLREVVAVSTAQDRFLLLVVATLAVMAFVLAAVGVFALTYQSVIERTREIGIRLALGATPRDINRWVLRQGLRPAVTGLCIGIAGGTLSTRLTERLLFGVSPLDGSVFGIVFVLLLLTALGAAYLPARRAAKLSLGQTLSS